MSASKRFQDRLLADSERIALAAELGTELGPGRTLGDAWKALCAIVHDETDSVAVRLAALRAIAHAPAAAVNQLTRSFHDPGRLVRKEALGLLRAIGMIGDEGRLSASLARLEQGGAHELMNLAMVFGYDARIVGACRKASSDPDARVREFALFGSAQLGEMDVVLAALADSAANVRMAAARYLGAYGTLAGSEIRALQVALEDPDRQVAASARSALKILGVVTTKHPGKAQTPAGAKGAEAKWHALLSAWSQVALEDRHYAATLDDEVVESGWLGFPGATDAELESLSVRLGTATLPPSYESFLRLTNGFKRISASIEHVFAAQEVRLFSHDHAAWIEAYLEPAEGGPFVRDEDHRRYGDAQDPSMFDVRYLSSAIQVSEVDDGVLLLNPAIVSAEGEWEAWFFANWLPGALRSPSFFELIQRLARARG